MRFLLVRRPLKGAGGVTHPAGSRLPEGALTVDEAARAVARGEAAWGAAPVMTMERTARGGERRR